MTYSDLMRLYFERSSALQWYWTIYVVIIGGLLAFSSLRQRSAFVTTILVSVLYGCFAYKNLGAIHDVTLQRIATVEAIEKFQVKQGDAPLTLNVPDSHIKLEAAKSAMAGKVHEAETARAQDKGADAVLADDEAEVSRSEAEYLKLQANQQSERFEAQRKLLEPTLAAPEFEGVRNFHILSDVLTVVTIWAMELRRRRIQRDEKGEPARNV